MVHVYEVDKTVTRIDCGLSQQALVLIKTIVSDNKFTVTFNSFRKWIRILLFRNKRCKYWHEERGARLRTERFILSEIILNLVNRQAMLKC